MPLPNALPDLAVNVDANKRLVEFRQKANRFALHDQVIVVPWLVVKKCAGAINNLEADQEQAGMVLFPMMADAPNGASPVGGPPALSGS